eukprot:GHVP01000064.1.p1 GENE.GHVP01000064.1~~GHVP01000064.1.p1  ORF type:complete len:122 (+),score=2.71 GHVP01000064.1:583-948(+)
MERDVVTVTAFLYLLILLINPLKPPDKRRGWYFIGDAINFNLFRHSNRISQWSRGPILALTKLNTFPSYTEYEDPYDHQPFLHILGEEIFIPRQYERQRVFFILGISYLLIKQTMDKIIYL